VALRNFYNDLEVKIALIYPAKKNVGGSEEVYGEVPPSSRWRRPEVVL
jgi:hypothetical protein